MVVRNHILSECGEVSGLERRRDPRLKIRRRCLVCPPGEGLIGVEGLTHDVSRHGILVQFPGGMFPEMLRQVGNSARICVDLPANPGFSPRYLEHQARVVRIGEAGESAALVAFRVDRVRVRTAARENAPAAVRIQ